MSWISGLGCKINVFRRRRVAKLSPKKLPGNPIRAGLYLFHDIPNPFVRVIFHWYIYTNRS